MKKSIKVSLILIAFNLFVWTLFAFTSNDLQWYNYYVGSNFDYLTYDDYATIMLLIINNLALLGSALILVKK